MSIWIIFGLVMLLLGGLFWALVYGGSARRKQLQDLENEVTEDILNDALLKDLQAANAMRKRVAGVPDSLPPVKATDTEPAPKRRGRRGPV